jgi:hemerythrin-like domain-containing protein
MGMTDNFRKEHVELVNMVKELSAYLDPAKVAGNGAKIRGALTTMAGKVKIHLATEDKVLYPALEKHKDPKVQAMAKQYATEMGQIKTVFEAYLGRYPTAQAIEGAAANWVKETKDLFAVLGKRIDKENNELYAAADKAS